MAFGDRFKKFYGKIDPFGGRMFGFDKDDRKKFAPKQQYWGGSKDYAERTRGRNEAEVRNAGDTVRTGIERSNTAADDASQRYGRLEGRASFEQNRAGERAAEERASALGSAGRMTGVADTEMAQDRSRMLALGDNLSRDYQRTADAQLRASQDSTQRQALAQGSRGGAGGLRAALAGSLNANQQAATQAQITNAQEQNQLMGMKADMYSRANDISGARAGIYGNAAGLYSGREDAARNYALAQQGVQGTAVGGRYGAQADAATKEIGAGTAARGQFLGAEGTQGSAELNAAREQEAARQANEKANYTQKWFPLKRFNAPA
jgi:hypothetical protein